MKPTEMSDEQINIAIAEACNKVTVDSWGEKYPIPYYCNDLNAMHEAETHLDRNQQYDYGEELREISGNVGPKGGHFPPNGWGCFALATLTARQRAEAFLKTIKTK